jgi:4-hydroxybenzoate polyprenyltransferase
MGFVYHAAVGLGSLHLLSQIVRVDLSRPADCLRKFVSNKWLGALIFAGIVADKLYLYR